MLYPQNSNDYNTGPVVALKHLTLLYILSLCSIKLFPTRLFPVHPLTSLTSFIPMPDKNTSTALCKNPWTDGLHLGPHRKMDINFFVCCCLPTCSSVLQQCIRPPYLLWLPLWSYYSHFSQCQSTNYKFHSAHG